MRRRDFITLLGGAAAARPLAARAQQPAMPVIAYLSSRSAESDVSMLVAFRRGLNETGYVEGRNLAIEYRFADGQYARLPALATDLIRRQVAVIVYAGAPSPSNPDAAWQQLRASQIPIVFNTGQDPVRAGLVASFNRPGGNITGISTLVNLLTGKSLGLLHELVPNARTIALLNSAISLNTAVNDAGAATATLGLQLIVLNADTNSEIDAAFATLNQQRADAMVVATSPFFVTRAKQFSRATNRPRKDAKWSTRVCLSAESPARASARLWDIASAWRGCLPPDRLWASAS